MRTLEMQKVESSQLSAWGHDPETNVLRVEFKNGSTYEYLNVETHTFEALVNSESSGKAFSASIKPFPTKYPFTKV